MWITFVIFIKIAVATNTITVIFIDLFRGNLSSE